MKHIVAAALFGAASLVAPATTVTETYTSGLLDQAIPDDSPVLTTFLLGVGTSEIVSLTRIRLSFELRGDPVQAGFARDMFASLIQSPFAGPLSIDDPAAVLLNRVDGTYDGWNITFDDTGAGGDIHEAGTGSSGTLVGLYEPDGRLDEDDVLRPALLDVFLGRPGNGDWRLNLGDLAAQGTMRLISWQLELTGDTGTGVVPETSSLVAGLAVTTVVASRCRRRRA